jgi:hypothetical protein
MEGPPCQQQRWMDCVVKDNPPSQCPMRSNGKEKQMANQKYTATEYNQAHVFFCILPRSNRLSWPNVHKNDVRKRNHIGTNPISRVLATYQALVAIHQHCKVTLPKYINLFKRVLGLSVRTKMEGTDNMVNQKKDDVPKDNIFVKQYESRRNCLRMISLLLQLLLLSCCAYNIFDLIHGPKNPFFPWLQVIAMLCDLIGWVLLRWYVSDWEKRAATSLFFEGDIIRIRGYWDILIFEMPPICHG